MKENSKYLHFKTGKTAFSAGILILFILLAGGALQAEVINKVIAVINDKIITYSDLMRMLYPLYVQYQKVYTREELEKRLNEARHDVLNQLIENELILQEAKKREKTDEHLDIPEKQVKEYVAGIIENFPSREVFLQSLEKERMTLQEFEKSIRDQLLVKKLTAKEVSARIMVTPQDIKKKYEENKENYMQPEEFHVFHILIKKTGDSEKDEEQKNFLEENRTSLITFDEFQSFARKHSEGPKRDKGGDMGFLKKGTLLKELDSAMETLKVGEISGIIETEIGFHLLFLKAKKKSEYLPLAEVWDSIKNDLYNEKAEEIRKKWIQELREKAYIKIIDE